MGKLGRKYIKEELGLPIATVGEITDSPILTPSELFMLRYCRALKYACQKYGLTGIQADDLDKIRLALERKYRRERHLIRSGKL